MKFSVFEPILLIPFYTSYIIDIFLLFIFRDVMLSLNIFFKVPLWYCMYVLWCKYVIPTSKFVQIRKWVHPLFGLHESPEYYRLKEFRHKKRNLFLAYFPLIKVELQVIDKDSTSDFSVDYLINILGFYFRTMYFGFEKAV